MVVGKEVRQAGACRGTPEQVPGRAIAGITAGALTFCGFVGFSRRKPLAGIFVAVAGVAGDLQESAMKRDLGIGTLARRLRDMGWTDRIDNLVRSFVVGACFVPPSCV